MPTTCVIRDAGDMIVASGTVLSETKTDCRVLLADFKSEYLLPVPGQPVILHLTNSTHGIRIFSARADAHTYNTISFTDMKLTRSIQRRSDVKISLFAQLSIYPIVSVEKDGKKVSEPDWEHPIAIDMADISAGGVGFYCTEELDRDKFYHLQMPVTNGCLDLKFLIVRRVDHTRGRYFYGCKFHQTPLSVESTLRSFIFRRGLFQ